MKNAVMLAVLCVLVVAAVAQGEDGPKLVGDKAVMKPGAVHANEYDRAVRLSPGGAVSGVPSQGVLAGQDDHDAPPAPHDVGAEPAKRRQGCPCDLPARYDHGQGHPRADPGVCRPLRGLRYRVRP